MEVNRQRNDRAHQMELIRQAQAGDLQAQETLVGENISLVHSVVRKFRDRGMDYDDIFQIGCVGFIKAIRRFDTELGVQFSTYAVPMIMGEIRRTLRDDGTVKVSRSIKEKALEIVRVQEEMRVEMGKAPTIKELAIRCAVKPEEVTFYLEALVQPLSIDGSPAWDEDGNLGLLSSLASRQDNETVQVDKILLKQAIANLPPRERKIIFMRYFEDRTQSEIAKNLGISQVQVSRLENKILRKLRSDIS